jgi:thioredoxin 1
MLFLPNTNSIRRTVFAAALAVVIAGCSKPREPEAPVAQMPLLSAAEDLDTALSRAGNRMLVLDFYADWCGPCRALAPSMNELAGEFKGRADFYRVNVDRSPLLAREFGVRGIPLVVFMKNDSVVHAVTGLNPQERYLKILKTCEGTGSADECMKKLKEDR